MKNDGKSKQEHPTAVITSFGATQKQPHQTDKHALYPTPTKGNLADRKTDEKGKP
jgi:hypothetical protein